MQIGEPAVELRRASSRRNRSAIEIRARPEAARKGQRDHDAEIAEAHRDRRGCGGCRTRARRYKCARCLFIRAPRRSARASAARAEAVQRDRNEGLATVAIRPSERPIDPQRFLVVAAAVDDAPLVAEGTEVVQRQPMSTKVPIPLATSAGCRGILNRPHARRPAVLLLIEAACCSASARLRKIRARSPFLEPVADDSARTPCASDCDSRLRSTPRLIASRRARAGASGSCLRACGESRAPLRARRASA